MNPLQFALPLTLSDQPSLSNFIQGANQEALLQCVRIAQGDFDYTALYLWGESGAGKSHLLHGLAEFPQVEWVDLSSEPKFAQVYVLDNVHELTRPQQEQLFHFYNRARAQAQVLVLTANCPPAHLPADFLPDLKTRLSWDLVYQLHVLTDDDKAQVLLAQAEQRGLTLGAGVVTYMLRHLSRDLSQLHRFLDGLDEYSLQTQRAVTLPLLKEWLEYDHHRTV
ncbi:MAG: DnaA regulatory inactivator Hda [Formosimonas sp.]